MGCADLRPTQMKDERNEARDSQCKGKLNGKVRMMLMGMGKPGWDGA